ncbi:hypothetical protein JTB14_015820 [Gonioctena quinquepunctata]|nr:hypothetical protein JTB14_015820 [Gonioctena quinquepunctata]
MGFSDDLESCLTNELNFMLQLGNYPIPRRAQEVDIDYEIVFGNGELLLSNWEKIFPNIVAYLQKDGHIMTRAAKALLEKSVKDSCDEMDSDEAEIDDGILDVKDEDSEITVKNIIEHDNNDTAATSALDMTNIATIKKDLSLKDFSSRINSEILFPKVCL